MTRRAVAAALLAVATVATACGDEQTADRSTLPPPLQATSTTLAGTTTTVEQPDGRSSTTRPGIGGVLDETSQSEPGNGAVSAETSDGADPNPADYVELSDESIAVSVPAAWNDTVAEPWDHNGELIGPSLGAAPDYAAFLDGWNTPGVFIAASRGLEATTAELLDFNDFSSVCEYVDRIDYDDGFYVGVMDVWEQCGGDSSFVVIAAEPPDQDYLTLIQLVIVSEADWDAADEVIRTFRVMDPDLPRGDG